MLSTNANVRRRYIWLSEDGMDRLGNYLTKKWKSNFGRVSPLTKKVYNFHPQHWINLRTICGFGFVIELHNVMLDGAKILLPILIHREPLHKLVGCHKWTRHHDYIIIHIFIFAELPLEAEIQPTTVEQIWGCGFCKFVLPLTPFRALRRHRRACTSMSKCSSWSHLSYEPSFIQFRPREAEIWRKRWWWSYGRWITMVAV